MIPRRAPVILRKGSLVLRRAALILRTEPLTIGGGSGDPPEYSDDRPGGAGDSPEGADASPTDQGNGHVSGWGLDFRPPPLGVHGSTQAGQR